MLPKLILFDCDGTLLDSQAMIIGAMEAAFQSLALPPPSPDAVRHVVGLSLPVAIAELVSGADDQTIAHLTEAYKTAYLHLRVSGTLADQLFPGMEALVKHLDGAGYLLGVATGKSSRGLKAVLEKYDLVHHFITLQTADYHPSKPDPSMVITALREAGVEPAQTLVIGDTSYDMEMARAARVGAIGVAWGYHPAERLHAAGAHGVAQDSLGLHHMIEGYFEQRGAA